MSSYKPFTATNKSFVRNKEFSICRANKEWNANKSVVGSRGVPGTYFVPRMVSTTRRSQNYTSFGSPNKNYRSAANFNVMRAGKLQHVNSSSHFGLGGVSNCELEEVRIQNLKL